MSSSSELMHHPISQQPDESITSNLHQAATNWEIGRERAKQMVDWEAWRERAQAIKQRAIANLPQLIVDLETRISAVGGHVHHAQDATAANAIISEICAQANARLVVKSKSMTSEEIGLNSALAEQNITAVETDLGEYIVQQLEQRPSHILAPAVHLNATQIAALFERLSGQKMDGEDTNAMLDFARTRLRQAFEQADVGITGANFAVAQTGTLILVESEGNIRYCTSLPRVHIALMGIEKLLENWDDAAHMMQMLVLSAHGRRASASTSFITGPSRDGDDGPQEFHLVLLDNGRNSIREGEFSSTLNCIRCGACLYACPVYRQIGGHSYGSTYSGPIGSVLTPLLEKSKESEKLPWLSSLCGACSEACPVKIPLDDQLIALRGEAQKPTVDLEAAMFKAWAMLWSHSGTYRASTSASSKIFPKLLARISRNNQGWTTKLPFPFSAWTKGRKARTPTESSFHERWQRNRD